MVGLDHELKKIAESFDGRPRGPGGGDRSPGAPSPALLRAQAAALRSHFAFSRAVVRRAREAAARRVGRFADEAVETFWRWPCARSRAPRGERAAKVAFTVEAEPELRAHVDRDALLRRSRT